MKLSTKRYDKPSPRDRDKDIRIELITRCPRCGGETDLWSPEEETTCIFCGLKVFERESTIH